MKILRSYKDESYSCKENVLEIIDGALTANRKADFCTCQYSHEATGYCNHCTINNGLRAARACIVASVDRISIMRANMVAVQAEIEAKLRKLLEV